MKRFFILLNIALLAVACKNAPKEPAVDYSKFGGSLGNVEMIVENEYAAVFNGNSYDAGLLLGTAYDFFDEDGNQIKHQYAGPDGNIKYTVLSQYADGVLVSETNNDDFIGYDLTLSEKKEDGTRVNEIKYKNPSSGTATLHVKDSADVTTTNRYNRFDQLQRRFIDKKNLYGQIIEHVDYLFFNGNQSEPRITKYVYENQLLLREDAIESLKGGNVLYEYTSFDETGNWLTRIEKHDQAIGYPGNIEVHNIIRTRSYTYRKAGTEGK